MDVLEYSCQYLDCPDHWLFPLQPDFRKHLSCLCPYVLPGGWGYSFFLHQGKLSHLVLRDHDGFFSHSALAFQVGGHTYKSNLVLHQV